MGTELIARVAMGLCAALLLVVYAAGWHDETGNVLFGVALLFLTVGAISRP